MKSNKGTQLLLINNTHSHLQEMKNTPFNEFKPPYNTMQATRLLQHNNPPQNQSQTSQVQCLQVLKSNKRNAYKY